MAAKCNERENDNGSRQNSLKPAVKKTDRKRCLESKGPKARNRSRRKGEGKE
jgi:hypothetical protein